MRAIAKAANVSLAPERCRPNIVVSFATDGAALTRVIAAKSAQSLAEVSSSARVVLLTGPAPVRWRYGMAIEGGDGRSLKDDPPPAVVAHNPSSGGESDLPQGVPTLSTYTSSIISTQAVRVIRAATIVVDTSRADGRTLDAFAAFAALVAFAEIKPTIPTRDRSILGLFDVARYADALTDRDTLRLKARYRMPLDRDAQRQRAMLAQEMATDLTQGADQ